jgi:hypothetical protein
MAEVALESRFFSPHPTPHPSAVPRGEGGDLSGIHLGSAIHRARVSQSRIILRGESAARVSTLAE